jgi:hypothetical protein
LVKLSDLNVDFDCYKETPYFQVNSDRRIRFGMENLNMTLINKIVEDVFNEQDNISVVFVSEYIVQNKRRSSKSKVGKVIDIKNWHETVVEGEFPDEGVVYATVKNLTRNDVAKYALKVYKGHPQAFLAFYSDKFLFYVSSDVIDIISKDTGGVTSFKKVYSNLFDKYYEGSD